MISSNIEKLGFDKWFQDHVEPQILKSFELARVFAVHKDSYTISNSDNHVFAELVEKIVYNADSPIDYPTVGDWVYAKFYDENTFSIIHDILPRKSLLTDLVPVVGKVLKYSFINSSLLKSWTFGQKTIQLDTRERIILIQDK